MPHIAKLFPILILILITAVLSGCEIDLDEIDLSELIGVPFPVTAELTLDSDGQGSLDLALEDQADATAIPVTYAEGRIRGGLDTVQDGENIRAVFEADVYEQDGQYIMDGTLDIASQSYRVAMGVDVSKDALEAD